MKIDNIMDATVTWLTTGELITELLADDFIFTSPFWQRAERHDFIEQFKNTDNYQQTALSKIKNFSPIIKLKSDDEQYFAVVLQYHTVNDSSVYETVLGRVEQGKLVELRSIYDLNETIKALDLQ